MNQSTALVSQEDLPNSSTRSALIRGLNGIVDNQFVLTTEEALRPFECDGLSVYRQLPMAAVLPADTEEVQAIMRLCHRLKVPVVTRGAGTGLSAGALPHPHGLLLVLSRLQNILSVDTDNQTATLQPGVRNLAVSEAVKEHGLFYAPDPSSQIACSVGGNVAENAGGVHCLKYGLTVHNILRLTVVNMQGELFHVGADALDSEGFSLLPLLIGSEGMLGVVTEITVRLVPVPQSITVLLASFASITAAGQAVSDIIARGVIPAGLEMMDNNAIRAADDFVQAGYPRDAAAILLIELDGSTDCLQDQKRIVRQVLDTSGVVSLREARDEEERLLFWKGRKSAFPAVGRLSPDYYCMDGTIPRSTLAEVLEYITALSEEYGFAVANVFHAGDGNLHPLILFDANVPGQLERVEEMGGRILQKCIAVGGTITGEHGVGLEKIRQMPLQFSDAEIRQFHAVKKALDPDGLLNPGKNIPLLKHCQEYRALANDLEPNALHSLPRAEQPREGDDHAAIRQLREQLLDACNDHRQVCVDGNHSKAWYGFPLEGEQLSARKYQGMERYDPAELVITARAGTSLEEIETVLAKQGQMLACEPPHFGKATLGGMLGAGLSGPRRPFAGSVADQVLGCRIMNGRGEVLSFGGRVMKNVAGYDLSRLMVGSLGCLGIILECTLRVVPKPAVETAFRFDIDVAKTSRFINQLRRSSLPVTATCHDGQCLRVRFSGGREEMASLTRHLDALAGFIEREEEESPDFWLQLREHQLPFFSERRNLWRLSVPAATPALAIPGNLLTEWGGALRWIFTDAPADDIFEQAARHGGHATLFRADAYQSGKVKRRFQPLSEPLLQWHRNLKLAFDPDQLLNLSRFQPEL